MAYLKPIIGYEGVSVDGEDMGVPAPDPGHGFVAQLLDLAGQVGVRPQLRRDVRGRRSVEVGSSVQAGVTLHSVSSLAAGEY